MAEEGEEEVDLPKNGPGDEEYEDGSKYEGNFVDGKRQGEGQFTWPNGQYYKVNRAGCRTALPLLPWHGWPCAVRSRTALLLLPWHGWPCAVRTEQNVY